MTRPNVIVIVADDMGYGDLGIFGDGSSKTPVLDQFASESVCLTQHYSAAPVCTPARAALLTGRYPHRTGAIDMRELRGLSRLALRERTIGDYFTEAGYVTGLIGKWHTGTIGRAYHPNARGFGEFVGFRGGVSDYYDWRLYYNETIRDSDGRYITDVFAAEAVDFLRRHRNEPFFLHLAFNAPHTPLQAPPHEVAPFAETGNFTSAVATIYGMIHRMDTAIGQVLDELAGLGLAENTIVLFASDNGPQFGGTGDGRMDRFNGMLAGSKSYVYEGGIRVPGLIRWPAGLQGGRRLHTLIHFTDWLPTLLAAAGIEPDFQQPVDGRNALPALRGDADDGGSARRFWQWNRYRPLVTATPPCGTGPGSSYDRRLQKQ